MVVVVVAVVFEMKNYKGIITELQHDLNGTVKEL